MSAVPDPVTFIREQGGDNGKTDIHNTEGVGNPNCVIRQAESFSIRLSRDTSGARDDGQKTMPRDG